MLTAAAVDLILSAESLGQPGVWPGGDSGITIGYGYDLGQQTVDQFEADWGAHLGQDELARLALACGRRGGAARALAPGLRDIQVTAAAAWDVFSRVSLPRYEAMAREAFGPGFDLLPADAQGALVSLVFNRGARLRGDRRREMLAIRRACDRLAEGADLAGVLAEVAAELRAMKRLWVGKNLDGLLARREAEARLVELQP